nr:AraC family ligand binding domain-containing protein [Dubosiella newyorkensis]
MRITTNSTDFYFNADAMVYTQGYEECEPGHSYGSALRKSYMIHYITQGKGIFKVNGKTYSLQRGDLFFIAPGQEIYYEADQENPWGSKTPCILQRHSQRSLGYRQNNIEI